MHSKSGANRGLFRAIPGWNFGHRKDSSGRYVDVKMKVLGLNLLKIVQLVFVILRWHCQLAKFGGNGI